MPNELIRNIVAVPVRIIKHAESQDRSQTFDVTHTARPQSAEICLGVFVHAFVFEQFGRRRPSVGIVLFGRQRHYRERRWRKLVSEDHIVR